MAKNSIRDYSATNSANTDIQSIDISEGCSPAGINNAIREVMADLKDVSTGAVALESPAFDSASLTGNLTFGDNDKAIFGAGSDLQVYHDGSHSYIDEAGTGDIYVSVLDDVIFRTYGTNELVARFNTNQSTGGWARLYHRGSQRLATTSTGVDVTGTVTADGLTISDANPIINFTDTTNNFDAYISAENGNLELNSDSNNESGSASTMSFKVDNSEVIHITGGNVGIGTTSPSSLLHLDGTTPSIYLQPAADTEVAAIRFRNAADNNTQGMIEYNHSENSMSFRTNGVSDRISLRSTGDLLVGTLDTTVYNNSADTSADDGINIRNDGKLDVARYSGIVLGLNRTGPDGTVVEFRKSGVVIGEIGAIGGDIYVGTGSTTIRFTGSDIRPTDGTGANNDNVIDLGDGTARFDDVYATNGTIQTSDANEKQQIAALTDAEITAAKAISQLFKTFKWNDSVAEKGNAARTHTGVIAQDVEAAMTAAGLDAGDYAFFISSTWWETQTEVPAVEAVEAVDAIYEDVVIPAVEEELDEDGNVIVEAQAERTEQRLVSEAIEAVEAVSAYTRTDTYDTAEEAPEGATERTRLGIRYPELLAFIGAATEQRLSNIETRLAALEAN